MLACTFKGGGKFSNISRGFCGGVDRTSRCSRSSFVTGGVTGGGCVFTRADRKSSSRSCDSDWRRDGPAVVGGVDSDG